jgi:hypothetical protein
MATRPSQRRTERPKNDFFKLVGTAALIIVAVGLAEFLAVTHHINQLGQKRVLSAVIYLFGGAYGLYVTQRYRKFVSHLPDSIGNRKIKRLQAIFLIGGLLLLFAAAWNFWLLAVSK